MTAYYNEFDPYAAQWLRNLIAAGHIAPGVVDERSILDVRPSDLAGFVQCHFFAGIGGWSYAARLAGWSDDRPLWTGSCPCQPFSAAGKQAGQADERHLWPAFFELIRACRPAVVMGEQVAAAVGKNWLDGVFTDLEGVGYAPRAAVVPACAIDAPHRRDRLWFVADTDSGAVRQGHQDAGGRKDGDSAGQEPGPERSRHGNVGGASSKGLAQRERDGRVLREALCAPQGQDATDAGGGALPSGRSLADAERSLGDRRSGEPERRSQGRNATWWSGAQFAIGADGKARRVEPSIRLLAHGVPARVGKLRALGNAIVPQVAAEVIGAYTDDVDSVRLGVFA